MNKSTALTTLTNKLAARFGINDGSDLIETLKATAFKGQVSDAQMTALLIVADQYGLNPWTKEIYAFPDKKNGIVPVVGVDGWSRIINEHPAFDGIEFEAGGEMSTPPGANASAPEWMKCTIYRKDRSRPVVISEYLDEVYRAPFKNDNGYESKGPWQTHPKRFLRHKTMIQCARLAFGFVGIYDQDEAERIIEKDMGMAEVISQPQQPANPPALPAYPESDFKKNLPTWRTAIAEKKATADQIIARSSSRYTLSDAQKAAIKEPIQPSAPAHEEEPPIDADFVREMEEAGA